MTNFEIVEGSPGLRADEVVHVFIPGRGRNSTGDGLTTSGANRAELAAKFYIEQALEMRNGVIVPAGYKTPAENNGAPWSPEDNPSEVFIGIPEAELMRRYLIARGIGATTIRAERYSIDTVTNFVYAERGGYFPDDRPVAIVAQEEHLDRMLKIIAPRTLRRDYLGVVVPETGPDKEHDSFLARIFSRSALLGITPETENAVETTTRRVNGMWTGVNFTRRVARPISSINK
jgi:hypothetical protein